MPPNIGRSPIKSTRPSHSLAGIEHLRERMPQDRQEQERRAARGGPAARISQPRRPVAFALRPELDGKKAGLAGLEADLAATASPPLAKAA